MLYGLIHARYILTAQGLSDMVRGAAAHPSPHWWPHDLRRPASASTGIPRALTRTRSRQPPPRSLPPPLLPAAPAESKVQGLGIRRVPAYAMREADSATCWLERFGLAEWREPHEALLPTLVSRRRCRRRCRRPHAGSSRRRLDAPCPLVLSTHAPPLAPTPLSPHPLSLPCSAYCPLLPAGSCTITTCPAATI